MKDQTVDKAIEDIKHFIDNKQFEKAIAALRALRDYTKSYRDLKLTLHQAKKS